MRFSIHEHEAAHSKLAYRRSPNLTLAASSESYFGLKVIKSALKIAYWSIKSGSGPYITGASSY